MMRRYLPRIALAALPCGQALADSPTFSYLDVGYVRADDAADGGALRASAAIGDHIFLELDSNARDHLDGTVGHASLGAGLHWPVIGGIEAAFSLSADLVGGSFEGPDDTGWDSAGIGGGAALELRARPSPRVELNAGARFETVSDHLTASAGARFYFSRRLAAGIRVLNDYFDTRVELALHINFGD